MIAGQQCPLCGEAGQPWVGELRQCCGCLLAWVYGSAQAYEAIYQNGYHSEFPGEYQRLPFTERFPEHSLAAAARVLWIRKRWPEVASVLDVGSANGAFVFVASRDAGYRAEGLEPSPDMRQWVLRQTGIQLLPGMWQDLPARRWDLITGFDIIEHLVDPEGFMRQMREHTSRLLLETPDWREGLAPDWKHIKPKEHVCLFSEPALRALGERAGWQVDSVYRPVPDKLGIAFVAG